MAAPSSSRLLTTPMFAEGCSQESRPQVTPLCSESGKRAPKRYWYSFLFFLVGRRGVFECQIGMQRRELNGQGRVNSMLGMSRESKVVSKSYRSRYNKVGGAINGCRRACCLAGTGDGYEVCMQGSGSCRSSSSSPVYCSARYATEGVLLRRPANLLLQKVECDGGWRGCCF